jgi:hypothetical protein
MSEPSPTKADGFDEAADGRLLTLSCHSPMVKFAFLDKLE